MNGPALGAIGVLLGLAVGFPLGAWNSRRVAEKPAPPTAAAAPAKAETRPGGEAAPPADGPRPPTARPGPADKPASNPPPESPPDPRIASDADALRLLSGSVEEREAAAGWFRKRLLTASPAELADLDSRIGDIVAGWSPGERARLLNSLFRCEGFLNEKPGPPLFEGRLRRLFFDTIAALPEGDEHSHLVETLSSQLSTEKGAHWFQLSEVLQTTLSAERLRLLGARSPLGDEASAVLAREMERFAESRKDDRHYEMWSLIGFAGNAATETDRKTLMRYASEYPQSQPRQVALLAMTTVGPSPELDQFCAGIAADSNRPLAERLLGWHRLKKQGRDDLLSTAAQNEILRLWEESGEESMEDVIDIK